MFIKNNKGFSLIEILVTIGIVAVLGSIAVPAYNQYKDNANETAVKADVANSQKAYLAKDAVSGGFCFSLADVGLSNIGSSDLYTKASESFIGFATATDCSSVPTGIKKEKNNNMTITKCKLDDDSFLLGGGFKKGQKYVGYFIGNTDAGPRASKTTGTCKAKTGMSCSHTTKATCVVDTNCTGDYTATALSDICEPEP